MSHILYYQMSIELREIDIVETVFGVDDHEDLLAAIQNAGGVSAAEIMDDTGLEVCVKEESIEPECLVDNDDLYSPQL